MVHEEEIMGSMTIAFGLCRSPQIPQIVRHLKVFFILFLLFFFFYGFVLCALCLTLHVSLFPLGTE